MEIARLGPAVVDVPRMEAERPTSKKQVDRSIEPLDTWVPPTTTGEWSYNTSGVREDPVTLYLLVPEGLTLDDIAQAAGWSAAAPDDTPHQIEYFLGAVPHQLGQWTNSGLSAVTGFINHVVRGNLKAPQLPDIAQHTVNTMPMSSQTYAGVDEMYEYEMGNQVLDGRHHWRAPKESADYTPPLITIGNQRYVVYPTNATHDTAIGIDPTNWQGFFLTHLVDPNAGLERDFIDETFRKVGAVASEQVLHLNFGPAAPSGVSVPDEIARVLILQKPTGHAPNPDKFAEANGAPHIKLVWDAKNGKGGQSFF